MAWQHFPFAFFLPIFSLLPHLTWWTRFLVTVGDEEGAAEEFLNTLIGGVKRWPGCKAERRRHVWWWAVPRVSAAHGWRSAVGCGAWPRDGGGVTVVDWGSGAATGISLGAVVPAVQVEQRGDGSSSGGAQLEDGGERKRHGGCDRGHDELEELGKMVEGEHGGGPYMLGRLESCPGRAYLKREGKAATSSRAARLGVGLRGEVGKVGDDHVPRMCGRGGKARGRWRHGEQCARSGHGGCRSGEEEGLDRWAPPVSSRRERMEAKWRKKR
uniref:DUF834 domain-containing protein n=1 Tax=Oryza sativa subsp. japonica TaxID=39947 RepID=Q2R3R0_ORYSJ|nr:hypothetical protein LOC_Os11g31080 [Oryza sativa Japonica Group]